MRNAKLMVALGLAASILPWGAGRAIAAATKPLLTVSGQTVTVPAEVPDRADLTLLGTTLMNGAVIVLLYDDPRTGRSVDYAEAYDRAGNLLFIGSIDGQGHEQVAYDRNLTESGATGPSGVFVLRSRDDRAF